jgi:murein DD-endopeptidase MepM/ murein hydrolase activator NlpD
MVPGAQPPDLDNFLDRVAKREVAFYRGNDFKNNEDHYCFGRLIVAPGAGLVFDTKDGVFDNVPLTPNENEIPGNYIVIDHMNGEYSMLAHFKQGSILVNNGDKVKAGDPLGLCGNSGNSYVPHLHYHLQNTPRWLDGEGLPAQFQNYTANGLNVYRGEPVQGEIIDSRCSSSSC